MVHRVAAKKAKDTKTRKHEARSAVSLFLLIGLKEHAASDMVRKGKCSSRLELD